MCTFNKNNVQGILGVKDKEKCIRCMTLRACPHLYFYMYEVKLLVNEIEKLVDDFHLLQFEKWHPSSSQQG
jgi:hypothetical protein